MFSRENPSPRYVELLSLCRQLHTEGDQLNNIPPDQTFDGASLKPHVGTIGSLIQRHSATSLLDYGSGKAEGYNSAVVKTPGGEAVRGLQQYWGLDAVTHYDPGYEPFSDLPGQQYDGVISTDVLEHCPKQDIDWILREIFSYSRIFVFCTVAVYPANKKLPTGENAHVTIESPGWWLNKFGAARDEFPLIRYHLAVMHTRERMTYIEG